MPGSLSIGRSTAWNAARIGFLRNLCVRSYVGGSSAWSQLWVECGVYSREKGSEAEISRQRGSEVEKRAQKEVSRERGSEVEISRERGSEVGKRVSRSRDANSRSLAVLLGGCANACVSFFLARCARGGCKWSRKWSLR